VRAATARDVAGAREHQAVIDRLVHVLHAGPFPSTGKFLARRLRGADDGYRSPYDPLTPEEERRVLEALAPHEAEFRRYG
jgi:dihydrodipicolinate synthase/N-acetylneuraminate lyase